MLEHLERPDNLVQYQIVKEIKFNSEHRSKLAEVENAINPDVVPVSDSAVGALSPMLSTIVFIDVLVNVFIIRSVVALQLRIPTFASCFPLHTRRIPFC